MTSNGALRSATVICTNKTGTLTTNNMTVQHVFYDLKEVDCDTSEPMNAIQGDFYKSDGQIICNDFLKLVRCATLCNNAQFSNMANAQYPGDVAILNFSTGHISKQYNMSITEYYAKHKEIYKIAFNANNKYEITMNEIPNDMLLENEKDDEKSTKNRCIIQAKGAPENILKICDRYLINDEVKDLDDKTHEIILKTVSERCQCGQRIIAFAELILDHNIDVTNIGNNVIDNDINSYNWPFNRNDEEGLIFIGFQALIDPPRPRIAETTLKYKEMGLKVILISGDHMDTTKTIAEKCNIIDTMIVNGDEIRDKKGLLDDALDKDCRVFVRMTANHKVLLISKLQERGEKVIVFEKGWNPLNGKIPCIKERYDRYEATMKSMEDARTNGGCDCVIL